MRRKSYLEQSVTLDQLRDRYKSHPTQFEHYVATVFECLGYNAKVTKATGDCGKDIIMTKQGKKYIVEVELYAPTNKVVRDKIQKLHSASIDSKGDVGVFVTTSDFCKPAVEYAKKHKIQLINGEEMIALIRKAIIISDENKKRVDNTTLELKN